MRRFKSVCGALALVTAMLLLLQTAVQPAYALTTTGGGKKPESTQTSEDDDENDGDSVQGGGSDSVPGGDSVSGGSTGDAFDDGDEAPVVTYTNILPWGIAAMNSGEPLSEEELEEINDGLDYTNMGFCMTTYSRPEEINWHQVLYNGGGLALAMDEDLTEAYLKEVGREEIFGEVEIIAEEDLEEYVKETTGTDYSRAERSLYVEGWMYLPEYDAWCWEHGDTNLYPFRFESGTKDGDIYHLQYAGYDNETFVARNFVLTARIGKDGQWTYLSNLPADAPAPRTLASIEFYTEKEEALAALSGEPEDIIEIEQRDYDEPYNWFWTAITAEEDIFLSVERMDFADDSRMVLSWESVFVPDEWIKQVWLKKGESILLFVNMPWNPCIRVNACAASGQFYGEYLFGSDNYLHLDDPETGLPYPRYVVGHDADGEGHGLNPADENELTKMLRGSWVYFDPDDGEISAVVHFADYRYMSVMVLDGEEYEYFGDYYINYDHFLTGPEEVPDVLSFSAYGNAWEELPGKEHYAGEDLSIGDYSFFAEQSIGAQKLTLQQNNNGFGFLSDLIPGAEQRTEYTFYRYEGAYGWKSAYKDMIRRTVREAAEPREGEEEWERDARSVVAWSLYDIDKDGTPELLIECGPYEAIRGLNVYTFTGQEVSSCCDEQGNEGIIFGHASAYTVPGENGLLLWRGHMGWAQMLKYTKEYVELTEEQILEEDINEALSQDPTVEYTLPSEVIPGSVALSMFAPSTTLPIDYYELYSELSGEFDPTSPALPTALDPSDPYGAWVIRMASGTDKDAEEEIPEWLEEAIDANDWIYVVPTDVYMNRPGMVHYEELFEDGVVYEYTGGPLHDTHWYTADLDGDGMDEAVCFLAESNNNGDSYRVVFRQQGRSIYAYTSVNWSWGKTRVTEDGRIISEEYADDFRPERVFSRRGQAFDFGVY